MSITQRAGAAAIVIVPVFVTFAMIVGGTPAKLGAFALVVLTVGAYIGLRHPLYLSRALAFSLGALPFGYVPGVHAPLVFALGIAVVLATVIHRTAVSRITWPELPMIALIAASALSIFATSGALVDYVEFGQWLVSTLVVVCLLRMQRDELALFGRIYVYAASAAAAFALVIFAVDPAGKLIRYLSIFGYGSEEESTRFVYSSTGAATVRLAGTYVDPNAAGIGFVLALMLCVLLLRGYLRTALAALLFLSIVLTLSRAALFSVVFGVVLMLVFQQLRTRERLAIVGAFAAAFVGAIAVPTVRNRVFSSFGNEDAGSSARGDALVEFPGHMQGHWMFGLGWGRAEFKDPTVAFEVNYVANTPLLTIYRGGLVAGIAFVAILVVIAIVGYKLLRARQWEYGFYGGGMIGFSVVALQLDFPVVTIPATTMAFSVMYAFLVLAWEKASETDLDGENSESSKTKSLLLPDSTRPAVS
ncbi:MULTISPECIES: O-antigen ligase domain-containing protein [unclassified Rhodococcus (in: high G+C Gram-positive bacteria)]|uniref:O-antigen ligase domain-containing protein n=1 Tax=unclassified Rhodococcus (in: high G+C Gram-positive bacteria) TaxID=192944 RepID=UPI00211B70B0|nr:MULTISPECIES: O-antigen ligase domain-containing protein [unclassified Rhodococcus (in: high G+C Gram-positive bacteria)]